MQRELHSLLGLSTQLTFGYFKENSRENTHEDQIYTETASSNGNEC